MRWTTHDLENDGPSFLVLSEQKRKGIVTKRGENGRREEGREEGREGEEKGGL